MRAPIALTALLASLTFAAGQDSTNVRFADRNDMEFQMRGSFRVEMPGSGPASAKFRMDNFRWDVRGNAVKNISYRFRQSLTSAFTSNTLENLLASVNYAYITWAPFKQVSFTAGKNVLALGGHEFWAAPVNVIEFSDFGGSLSAYQMGLNLAWNISDRHELVLQMSNLRGTGDDSHYLYGLPEGIVPTGAPFMYTVNWNGNFFNDNALELRYSASYGQQAKGKSMGIISLGQSYRRKAWGAFLDLTYSRQGLDANGILSGAASFADGRQRTLQNTEYFSAVAYLHLFISPSFNMFFKGVGETGGLYRKDGDAAPGLYRYNWNAQACLQYMPTKDRDFRLFAHYSYYSADATDLGKTIGIGDISRQTVQLGIIYIMKVF